MRNTERTAAWLRAKIEELFLRPPPADESQLRVCLYLNTSSRFHPRLAVLLGCAMVAWNRTDTSAARTRTPPTRKLRDVLLNFYSHTPPTALQAFFVSKLKGDCTFGRSLRRSVEAHVVRAPDGIKELRIVAMTDVGGRFRLRLKAADWVFLNDPRALGACLEDVLLN